SSAIANVLMSSAECENGLSPANRIMYQYTNMKSYATGYATKTGLPGSDFSQATYFCITIAGSRAFSRAAAQASGCVCHHSIVFGSPAAPGNVSRLAENVL